MTQNLFYFSDAGKFCLAHGLGQLTCDVKSEDRTLNFRSDVIFAPPQSSEKVDMRRKMSKLKALTNVNFIGNKHNQTTVFDAGISRSAPETNVGILFVCSKQYQFENQHYKDQTLGPLEAKNTPNT